jgi:hypothetical protein
MDQDISTPNAMPHKAHVNPNQHGAPDRPIDKHEAARDAKKKRRRKAHRAALRRSHTDG